MSGNENISVVIHGPYTDNAYDDIFKSLMPIREILNNVVVSTYEYSREKTQKILDKFNKQFNIKVIYVKDLINPGYFNINRQIVTVKAGLSEIENGEFVIKLRNDQWFDANKLLRYINKKYFVNNGTHKILTTNCFTRQDRLYHPSDMLLCGWKEDLNEYFNIPLQQTHMNTQLEMLKKLRYCYDEFQTFVVSPENQLFKHYLLKKNWDFKDTVEDSYQAIKEYMFVVNTWDIDLRWNKKRNAILPAKTIILPYSFTMAPFQGAPEEQALCYARHHFDGNKTLKDSWFIFFSRFVFSVKYNKIHRILVKIKNKVPKPIRKVLLKTSIGKKLKSIS